MLSSLGLWAYGHMGIVCRYLFGIAMVNPTHGSRLPLSVISLDAATANPSHFRVLLG